MRGRCSRARQNCSLATVRAQREDLPLEDESGDVNRQFRDDGGMSNRREARVGDISHS